MPTSSRTHGDIPLRVDEGIDPYERAIRSPKPSPPGKVARASPASARRMRAYMHFDFPHPPSFLGHLYAVVQLPLAIVEF